jgi:hypothetical protein
MQVSMYARYLKELVCRPFNIFQPKESQLHTGTQSNVLPSRTCSEMESRVPEANTDLKIGDGRRRSLYRTHFA